MRSAFNDLASYLALVLIPSLRATLGGSAGPITCSLTEAWTAYLRSKPLLIRRVRSGKKHDLDVAILPAISAVFYLTSPNPFSKEEQPCPPY